MPLMVTILKLDGLPIPLSTTMVEITKLAFFKSTLPFKINYDLSNQGKGKIALAPSLPFYHLPFLAGIFTSPPPGLGLTQ